MLKRGWNTKYYWFAWKLILICLERKGKEIWISILMQAFGEIFKSPCDWVLNFCLGSSTIISTVAWSKKGSVNNAKGSVRDISFLYLCVYNMSYVSEMKNWTGLLFQIQETFKPCKALGTKALGKKMKQIPRCKFKKGWEGFPLEIPWKHSQWWTYTHRTGF